MLTAADPAEAEVSAVDYYLAESAGGDVVMESQLGPDWRNAIRELGWDRPTFLRKASGRQPLESADGARVERLGVQWLTLS